MESPSWSTAHRRGSWGVVIDRARYLRLANPSYALGILRSMSTAAGSRLRCEKCETEIIVVKGTDGEVLCCGQGMAAREG